MSGYETLSANSQNIKKFQLQQKARGFLVIFAIGVPVFLAMLAYLYYQDATQQNKTTATNQTEEAIALPETVPSQTTDPAQSVGGGVIPSSPATTPGQVSSNQPSGSIPAGVQTAINSIEANGIKGNAYVSSSLDTSSIPSGTSIRFERSSWTQYSDILGSVNATISILGQTRTGSVTFGVTEGAWKATGYSLN